MVDFSKRYDVLVVGGGNAALCAAIAARREGASVLVLEAAPKFYRGGNTRHTRNMRCAHDAATETLSGPYYEDEFFDDLLRVTGGNTNEDLARMMIHDSKDMLNWIAEQGVRFQPSLGGTLSLGRTNSFFLGGGRAMLRPSSSYGSGEPSCEVQWVLTVLASQPRYGVRPANSLSNCACKSERLAGLPRVGAAIHSVPPGIRDGSFARPRNG